MPCYMFIACCGDNSAGAKTGGRIADTAKDAEVSDSWHPTRVVLRSWEFNRQLLHSLQRLSVCLLRRQPTDQQTN